MSVKVELHGKNKGFTYPCLMIDPDTDLLLFMNSAECGTVIQSGSTRYFVAYYGTNWKMNRLQPFAGRVTLENN